MNDISPACIINLDMLQKLSRFYPPVIEILPLFLLFLVLYLVLSSYDSLPAQIPTHFNSQGVADGFGDKSTILLYPGFAGFLYILFTGVMLAMAVTHDPKKLINLPESAKEKITPDQAEALRSFILPSLMALKIIVMGLIAYLAYANLQVAFGYASDIGYWPFVFAAAILGVVGLLLLRVFRLLL